MFVVDINCDMGESFGNYKIGMDEEVIKLITSANIACGFHAGDPGVMNRTVRMAKEFGVGIGAHPGFPDLVGFGRRNLGVSPREVTDMIIYQVGALQAFAKSIGAELQHVKPHGALYNMSAGNKELAAAVVEGVEAVDKNLVLFGLAGSELLKAGKKAGLRVASEVFADRAYNDDGSLVSRRVSGAMIENAEMAANRVITMITEGYVESINGKRVNIKADTVCVHGDSPGALEFVRLIRKKLEENNIQVTPVGKFAE